MTEAQAPISINNELMRRNIDESVARLLLPFPAGEQQESLKGWINSLIMGVSVWALPAPIILKDLIQSIHTNQYRRDFVFSLSALFQARMEMDGFKFADVVGLVARCTHQSELGSEKNIMLPNLIEGRFASLEEWTGLLLSNKWLASLLVLMLYGSLHQDINQGR